MGNGILNTAIVRQCLNMLDNIVSNIRLRDNVAVVDDIPYLQFDINVRG
jgi:hypothetical protein